MPGKVNAPARAPFLQTPEAVIDDLSLTDAAVRLLQALVKLPPRNRRNSDAVARTLRMGKDKLNSSRKCLRAHGHWHARKRQNVRGEIRDQRMASLTPLRSAEEIAAGWAAAEEAARLGKDTARSRQLGVRLVNAAEWVCHPATGSPGERATRRRPLTGRQTESTHHTPLPVPAGQADAPQESRTHSGPPLLPRPSQQAQAAQVSRVSQGEPPRPARDVSPQKPPPSGPPQPSHDLSGLGEPPAAYAERAERVLLRLRRTAPQLTLSVVDARELSRIAGHYLLRGEGPDTLRAVLTRGLPPEGVRSPRAFVRNRLLRYLPPVPDWPWQTPGPASASPPTPERPRVSLVKRARPRPCRTGGPAHIVQNGGNWRDAFARALRPSGDEKRE